MSEPPSVHSRVRLRAAVQAPNNARSICGQALGCWRQRPLARSVRVGRGRVGSARERRRWRDVGWIDRARERAEERLDRRDRFGREPSSELMPRHQADRFGQRLDAAVVGSPIASTAIQRTPLPPPIAGLTITECRRVCLTPCAVAIRGDGFGSRGIPPPRRFLDAGGAQRGRPPCGRPSCFMGLRDRDLATFFANARHLPAPHATYRTWSSAHGATGRSLRGPRWRGATRGRTPMAP